MTLTRTPIFPELRSHLPLAVCAAVAVAVTWIGMQWPIAALGIIYVGGFVGIAWRWPQFALAAIFAAAPFQNDLSGGGPVRFSLAEINLFLTLPVFLTRATVFRRAIPVGPLAIPIALHFAVCLFCSAHSWRPSSLVSLVQMFLYMVAATTVFSCFYNKPRDLVIPLYALIFVCCFVAIMMMGAPSVLDMNKNGAGASLACGVVIGVELWFGSTSPKRRAALLLALLIMTAGLVCSLSRGSWMAAITGLIVITGLRRQFLLLAKMSVVLVPAIAVFWFMLPSESRDYATGFGKDRYNIQMRYESLELARRTFEAHPMTGVGVGLRKEYDATNVIMLTLAETGIPGLLTFLLIYVAVIVLVVKTQRMFSRTDPLYSLVALGGALSLGRLAHGLVDHYWSRGAVMIAWGSVGMTMAAYYVARQRLRASRLARLRPATYGEVLDEMLV